MFYKILAAVLISSAAATLGLIVYQLAAGGFGLELGLLVGVYAKVVGISWLAVELWELRCRRRAGV